MILAGIFTSNPLPNQPKAPSPPLFPWLSSLPLLSSVSPLSYLTYPQGGKWEGRRRRKKYFPPFFTRRKLFPLLGTLAVPSPHPSPPKHRADQPQTRRFSKRSKRGLDFFPRTFSQPSSTPIWSRTHNADFGCATGKCFSPPRAAPSSNPQPLVMLPWERGMREYVVYGLGGLPLDLLFSTVTASSSPQDKNMFFCYKFLLTLLMRKKAKKIIQKKFLM